MWRIPALNNRAAAYGSLTTVVRLLSGFVTALLIAFHFTPTLQGYYFMFASLLQLQVFVELGSGQAIIQFASHEWAHLSLDEAGQIQGDAQARSRLISVGNMAFRWYGAGGFILTTLMVSVGFVLMHMHPDEGIRWLAPWLCLCLFTGLDFSLQPAWLLLEGTSQIDFVYWFRLVRTVIAAACMWTGILLGLNLWILCATPVISVAGGLIGIYARYRRTVKEFMQSGGDQEIGWRQEVWPLQWRLAVSWISGYFATNIFTPILFHYQGAVVAGQFGMSWTVMTALTGVSSAWVTTKAPRFGHLIAKRDFEEADRLYRRATVQSAGLAALGAAGMLASVSLLYGEHVSLAVRLLPPYPTAILLMTTVLLQALVPQAVYLRSHKKEPYVIINLVGGPLIALSSWVACMHFGVLGMVYAYLLVTLLFYLPYVLFVWFRCRALWHAPLEPVPHA